jgi:Zn-dependent peptidase ImmA (M78 family)
LARKNAAETTAKQIYSDHAGAQIPTPVEQIAKSLGIAISFEPYEDPNISGALYRFGDGTAIIGVNSTQSVTRQRFTIAHEIGHYCLHEGREVFVDHTVRLNMRDGRSSLAVDREEIQANAFAAELLMPSQAVREQFVRLMGRARPSTVEQVVERLADDFNVSAQAMEYRLQRLDLLAPPV